MAIQCSELRTGNIVWDDYSGWMIVTELRKESLHMRHPKHLVDGSFNYDKIQPIPLTPDILEKCGFKKNKNGEPCIEINDIASHLELMVGVDNFHYPSFTQTPQGDEERTVYFNRINSLHQLQNLVHTITGEELSINL